MPKHYNQKIEDTEDIEVKKAKLDGEDEDSPYKGLLAQVQAEYEMAWRSQHTKVAESLARLKLYNNQKRDKSAVGDTTLFTTFQTVLAYLYDDRLTSDWMDREEGDEEVAENLNALAEFDYMEMGKDVSDFEWDWDTCFFGRGLLDFSEFIREPDTNIFIPVPKPIDPMTFLRDPRAVSINGHVLTHEGACRFFGREVRMTEDTMRKNPNIFKDLNYGDVKYGEGQKSLLKDAQEQRNIAQGLGDTKNDGEEALGANAEYTILEWHTHWRMGDHTQKIKVWLANDRGKLAGFQVLKEKFWKVIDRPLYPTSHDWFGTSIPDLTEDKQRARAVAQNLGMNAMKADLYPRYLYDTNKGISKNDLTFDFNKHIGVDGPTTGALEPVRNSLPNLPLLNFIYTSLDLSAQRATATPEIQQGIQSTKDRPLGETNLLATKVDTRQSLSAKVFGWSERTFWRTWYSSYKENFADKIDKKIIRLVGAFGPKHREFYKKDIITKRLDPDVFIESQNVSRAKQLEERQSLSQYVGIVLSEPTANRRYAIKKLGKTYGFKKDEMDRFLPPTIDELMAEDENELLNENKFVRVFPEDDDLVHLEIHSKINATQSSTVHVETHKRALLEKKKNPELAPQGQVVNPNAPPGTPASAGDSEVKPISPSQTSGGVEGLGGGQVPAIAPA